jgi:hypothetical protein
MLGGLWFLNSVDVADARYKKLQVAWKKARPTPTTPEDAAQLVVLTLKNHQKADVEVLECSYLL